MCDICKREECPPRCPNYKDDRKLRCRSCGLLILDGDGFYQKNGNPYCEDCMENATLEDLIRFCEKDDKDILETLGFSHSYYDMERRLRYG